AMHPHSARHLRAREKATQPATATCAELDEFDVHPLQSGDCGELRRIRRVSPGREDAFVLFLDVQCRIRGPRRQRLPPPASSLVNGSLTASESVHGPHAPWAARTVGSLATC